MPETAQLVLEVDLAALRSAPVLAAEGGERAPTGPLLEARLGLDPKQDLDRIVLAAASPDGAGAGARGDAELLLLVRGRFDRERVLAALGRRGELVKQRARGRDLYTPRERAAFSLIFLDGGMLAAVSTGWRERLLDRLEGRGRPVLEGRALGAELRAARRRAASARLASRLSPRLAAILAELTRWPELASLTLLSGSARADHRLELRIEAQLVESEGAKALQRRLERLGQSTTAVLRARAEERKVELRIDLDRALLRKVLSGLGSP